MSQLVLPESGNISYGILPVWGIFFWTSILQAKVIIKLRYYQAKVLQKKLRYYQAKVVLVKVLQKSKGITKKS